MADTGLFGRLRRLFSTDVIIRNDGGDQLKVVDINKVQASGEYETNSVVEFGLTQILQFMDIKVALTTRCYAHNYILNMMPWIQMRL